MTAGAVRSARVASGLTPSDELPQMDLPTSALPPAPTYEGPAFAVPALRGLDEDLVARIVQARLARPGHRLAPRVHVNGFLQLDLNATGTRRLHVFGDHRLPTQETRTEVHDHVFSMHSRVLVGRVYNTIWDGRRDERNATHSVYQAHYAPGTSDSELVDSGERLRVHVGAVQVFGDLCRRREYVVAPGDFHSSHSDGLAVTLMTKIQDPVCDSLRPRVLVPLGVKPDAALSRHGHDEAGLWRVLNEAYPTWYRLLSS